MRDFIRDKLGLDWIWLSTIIFYLAAAIYGSIEGFNIITGALVACGAFITIIYARDMTS